MIPRNECGGIQYGKVRDTEPQECGGCGVMFRPSRKQLWHQGITWHEERRMRPLMCSRECSARTAVRRGKERREEIRRRLRS